MKDQKTLESELRIASLHVQYLDALLAEAEIKLQAAERDLSSTKAELGRMARAVSHIHMLVKRGGDTAQKASILRSCEAAMMDRFPDYGLSESEHDSLVNPGHESELDLRRKVSELEKMLAAESNRLTSFRNTVISSIESGSIRRAKYILSLPIFSEESKATPKPAAKAPIDSDITDFTIDLLDD